MKPGPLTVRAMTNVMTVHTPTQAPNSTASQPGWTVLVLSHGMVAYSSGREARGYASVDRAPRERAGGTGGQGNPSGSPHRMNQELSDEVGEIMRKLVALTGAAVVATALVASPALADVPTKSKPPVKLQGKVTNKGTAT